MKYWMKQQLYKFMWRLHNRHNFTSVNSVFDQDKVRVGRGTYGYINVIDFNSKDIGKIEIGNWCSIADNTVFILSGEHATDKISTYPFKTYIMGEVCEAVSKGDITICDDVWIGYGCRILSGIRVGQGAVIAAASVVTKDIPPYAIAGGTPAKVIRYRFAPEIIHKLEQVDFSGLDENMVRRYIDELYGDVTLEKDLSWLPHR